MKLHEAVGKRILEFCNERDITPNKLCTMSGFFISKVVCLLCGSCEIAIVG